MKKAIREPFRFILQNVVEGEECIIHILQEEDFLVTYRLEEAQKKLDYPEDVDCSEEEIMNFESRASVEQKSKQLKVVKQQIKKILQLDKIYHNCTYLFLFKREKYYLLSYSHNEAPFSYTMVKHLSNILGLPVIKPNWVGIYSTQVLSAFYEDVFIQKK